jgi:hypothetical protein
MGSSALEIIFIPVLWGVLYGIVGGMAMLAVMNAVEALAERLGRRARSIEAVRRATAAGTSDRHAHRLLARSPADFGPSARRLMGPGCPPSSAYRRRPKVSSMEIHRKTPTTAPDASRDGQGAPVTVPRPSCRLS